MIAVARVSVNHDGKGGTAPDLLFGIRVAGLRFVNCMLELMLILHFFLALLSFFVIPWIQVDAGHITGADVSAWPYSVLFWLGSLPFFVLCTGLLVQVTWVILGSPSWNSYPFRAMGWSPVAW